MTQSCWLSNSSLAASVIGLIVTIPIIHPAAAQVSAAALHDAATENAADIYERVLGDQSISISTNEEGILGNSHEAPLDADTRRLVNKFKPQLNLVRRASQLAECEWRIDLSDGAFTRIADMNRSRVVVDALILHGRMMMEDNNPQAAVADWMDMFKLARGVARQNLIISRLAALGFEAAAVASVRNFISDLPPAPAHALAAELKRLRARPGLMATLHAEKALSKSFEDAQEIEAFYKQAIAALDVNTQRVAPKLEQLIKGEAEGSMGRTIGTILQKMLAAEREADRKIEQLIADLESHPAAK